MATSPPVCRSGCDTQPLPGLSPLPSSGRGELGGGPGQPLLTCTHAACPTPGIFPLRVRCKYK